MDDTIKTVLIDESNIVSDLVANICNKIGIANFDEYSLQMDVDKKVKASRDNISGIDDGKWLNPEKTLTEQSVVETDILLLKKKFFFSDQNVDRNDPIQLNLLYVQCRDAIIRGTHPCTMDDLSFLSS